MDSLVVEEAEEAEEAGNVCYTTGMKKFTKKIPDLESINKVTEGVNKHVANARQSTFKRFPRLFLMLSTFGFVLLLHGFEQTVSQIDLFQEQPFLILLIGIGLLFFTGTLYKKME